MHGINSVKIMECYFRCYNTVYQVTYFFEAVKAVWIKLCYKGYSITKYVKVGLWKFFKNEN